MGCVCCVRLNQAELHECVCSTYTRSLSNIPEEEYPIETVANHINQVSNAKVPQPIIKTIKFNWKENLVNLFNWDHAH